MLNFLRNNPVEYRDGREGHLGSFPELVERPNHIASNKLIRYSSGCRLPVPLKGPISKE